MTSTRHFDAVVMSAATEKVLASTRAELRKRSDEFTLFFQKAFQALKTLKNR
jgi:hypothetical protein